MNIKLDYKNKQIIILTEINLEVLQHTVMLFPDWKEWTIISNKEDIVWKEWTIISNKEDIVQLSNVGSLGKINPSYVYPNTRSLPVIPYYTVTS